jgi:transposase
MNSVATYVGLDYHTQSVQVCVMDAAGRTLGNRLCRNDATVIRAFAESFGRVHGAAIEACSGAADLGEERIQRCGWDVSLAHPGYVAAMKNSPDKHDTGDAHLIADLRRLGYLPRVWLAPRAIRELRSLVRYRQQLVDERRSTKLRIGALLRERRLTHPGPDNRWTRGWLTWLQHTADLGPHGSWIRDRHLAALRRLNDEIRAVEERLDEATRDDPVVARLRAEPGIGDVTAWVLRSEIGRFDRFRSGKQLARFCGLTPCNASSGQRQADAGLIRASSPQLRATLIELGQRLRRCEPRYQAMSVRMKAAGKPGSMIAAAVANRYMRKLFHRMRDAA